MGLKGLLGFFGFGLNGPFCLAVFWGVLCFEVLQVFGCLGWSEFGKLPAVTPFRLGLGIKAAHKPKKRLPVLPL